MAYTEGRGPVTGRARRQQRKRARALWERDHRILRGARMRVVLMGAIERVDVRVSVRI